MTGRAGVGARYRGCRAIRRELLGRPLRPRRQPVGTLRDNTAMVPSAERNGFVRQGVLRSSAWVMGAFLDEVLLGLLAQGVDGGRAWFVRP